MLEIGREGMAYIGSNACEMGSQPCRMLYGPSRMLGRKIVPEVHQCQCGEIGMLMAEDLHEEPRHGWMRRMVLEKA